MRWIVACALGEALGMAVVSLGYALGERGLAGGAAALLILAVGAFEGLSLGGAQAIAGRDKGVRAAPWIGATVGAAALGYGFSLIGQVAGGGAISPEASEPPFVLILAGGAGLGLFMGGLMGAAQSVFAPAGVSKRGWIVRNAAGWIPAMAVIMLAAAHAGAAWPLWRVAGLGAVAGALAGLFVGAATAGGLSGESARPTNREATPIKRETS